MKRQVSRWSMLPAYGAALIALASPPAASQEPGLGAALSTAIRNTNPPPGPATLAIFSKPIAVPNAFRKSNSFLSQLEQLDQIPELDGQPSGRSVYDALRAARDQVQVGRKRVSGLEAQALREAENFLYFDPTSRKPTPEYVAYTRYKVQSDAIKEKLAQPSLSVAERSGLLAQLKSVESDWKLYGYRSEVDQRLEVVRRFGENVTKALFDDWSDVLSSESSLDPSALDAVFGRLDWARVSFNGKAYGLPIVLSSQGASTTASDQVTVSFDYIIVAVRRRALEHPFLADVGWRLRGGKILSDGQKADSDTELLPRYYSHVVVAKNLELAFPANVSNSFLNVLASAKSLSISGLAFEIGDLSQRFQSRYVSLPGPFLLGGVVVDVPKTPNPEPERTWP